MNIQTLFADEYNRRSRLAPALFALFPAIVCAAVWLPDIYKFGTSIITIAIACDFLLFLANISRELGKNRQGALYEKWNGRPTTRFLRHHDNTINKHTQKRYHSFLATTDAQLPMPTADDEANDPDAADDVYEAKVDWLVAQTRDKKVFAALFEENVTYGYRRNMLGMKPIGIVISVASLFGCLFGIYLTGAWKGPVKLATVCVNAFALGLWMLVVTEAWVKSAGDEYAKRLLAGCDVLSKQTNSRG